MSLTDRSIQALKPKNNRYEATDDIVRGLRLKVYPGGAKSWIFRFQLNGKNSQLTLGTYPTLSLKDARIEANKRRELIHQGIDPAYEERLKRDENIQSPTVEMLAHEYIERHAKPNKKSWRRDQEILNRDVLPRWGYLKAKDINRRDVVALLDSIVDRGAAIGANRALAVIRKMFNFAIDRAILEASPCNRIKMPSKEKQRDRVLTTDEIRQLWHQLDETEISLAVRQAIKLILVTAQRKGEVIAARWTEIDGNWWTIPPEKAKNGISHRVPLSDLAVSILNEVRSAGSEYVFPSFDGTKPILASALDRAVRRNLERLDLGHFTPHDLRRSAASHMTSIGISRLVVSKILNHMESGVTAVYDRHGYDQEKRLALETWGKQLQTIIVGVEENNVIDMALSKKKR